MINNFVMAFLAIIICAIILAIVVFLVLLVVALWFKEDLDPEDIEIECEERTNNL